MRMMSDLPHLQVNMPVRMMPTLAGLVRNKRGEKYPDDLSCYMLDPEAL